MDITPLNEHETAEWSALTAPMDEAWTDLNGEASFLFSEKDELLARTEPIVRKRMFGLRGPEVIEQTEPGRYSQVIIARKITSEGALKSGWLEMRAGAAAIEYGRALPQTDASLRALGYQHPEDPENVALGEPDYLFGAECADVEMIRAAVVRSLQAQGLRPQDVLCERLG